ncbi:efflux RND transporter periplasmic adaptor subunit [Sphingobacterium paludis]|uniref:Membrane fusion protein (Multidrug efflux system) n=1 Tax=Sphingobacterium paludis TaxID=1476465 RepID=A0A4R7D1C2_9SPHI|nr:efflux RND transporter periplasmic adaptor subunit [Sphingobacterium paludis]TDS14510.1 membrane fusion protein (multidrug efflux system) [Sphingobacterium paludis]
MNKSFLFFPVVGMLWLFASCNGQSAENKSTSLREVPVGGLLTMDTTIYQYYIADIQATRNVELRSRLSGFLEEIYVDEGRMVKAGQVLFRINDEEYRADHAKAEAALNTAIAEAKKVELEKERTQKLVEKDIVSTTEQELIAVQYKAAQSKVAQAKAVVNQTGTRLARTLIRAPFSGRINRILLKAGSLLEEGALITSLSDVSDLNVYFDISEAEYLNLATDSTFSSSNFKRKVKLELANGQEYPHTGEARLVDNAFEPTTGSISLRAKFPNEAGLLKHGSSGKIAVPISTGLTQFVHQKSVFEIQDKAYVYVVMDDATVKMKPFIAGQRVGHYYIVTDGLDANDRIVYEGVQGLRDGMKIKPIAQK